jgi:hypothetical protein
MGFSLVPTTIVAMQDVSGAQSGLGSGLLNTFRLMGGALGLAVLSTLASSLTGSEHGVAPARALTDGFDLAFAVSALFCLVALVVAVTRLQPRGSLAIGGADRGPDALLTVSERADVEEAEALVA